MRHQEYARTGHAAAKVAINERRVLPFVLRALETGALDVARSALRTADRGADARAAWAVLRDAERPSAAVGYEQFARLGQGRPLSDALRAELERRFMSLGLTTDFVRVRLHTDGAADALCRALGARAATLGEHIVFRTGAFRPGSREGLELIAHELTHVAQLARGPVDVPGGISSPADAVEVEARAVAARIAADPRQPEHDAARPEEADIGHIIEGARSVLRDPAPGATATPTSPAPGDVIDGWVFYESDARSGGTLAWRNNNPGCMVHGAFADSHGAYSGKHNGRFAIFPTRDTGFAAVVALLRGGYASRTIAETIARYAPASDNNDPVAYAQFIQRRTGLESGRLIASLDDEELAAVARAIERMEGWRPGLSVPRSDPRVPTAARTGGAAAAPAGGAPVLRDCDPEEAMDGGVCQDAGTPQSAGMPTAESAQDAAVEAQPVPQQQYRQATIDYIRRLGARIRDAASRFGVPAGAVAGAVADEYDVLGALDRVQDAVVGSFAEFQFRDDRAANGLTGGSRANNAFRHDIGPGNVNLGTATRLVEEGRLQVPGAPPENLRYTAIVRSLLTDAGTIEAAAAVIQEGRDRFESAAIGVLARLAEPQREAVLVECYKQDGAAYIARYLRNRASDSSHLPQPGDDGRQFLANRARILDALGLGARSPVEAGGQGAVHRSGAGPVMADPQSAFDSATRGGATTLPHRTAMERAFGRSFADVRAHTGRGAELAAIGARAAARGNQVSFAETSPGPWTVAHELVHVVQSGGRAEGRGVSDPEAACEKEADSVADRVVRGESANVRNTTSGAIYRVTDEALNQQSDIAAGRSQVRATPPRRLDTVEDFIQLVERFEEAYPSARADPQLCATMLRKLSAYNGFLWNRMVADRADTAVPTSPPMDPADYRALAGRSGICLTTPGSTERLDVTHVLTGVDAADYPRVANSMQIAATRVPHGGAITGPMAATWSGDVGSAVAHWAAAGRTPGREVTFYRDFAGQDDLLGDVDGIAVAGRSGLATSGRFSQRLRQYYLGQGAGTVQQRFHTFCTAHGFALSRGRLGAEAEQRVWTEINSFARLYFVQRRVLHPVDSTGAAQPTNEDVSRFVRIFVDWVNDGLAREASGSSSTSTPPVSAARSAAPSNVEAGDRGGSEPHMSPAMAGPSGALGRLEQISDPAVPVPGRQTFERAFRVDLGDVRAYVGGPSTVQALSALGARALAWRNAVYFADQSPGQDVVGHELAHIVQSRGGSPGVEHRRGAPAELEQEADRVTATALRGEPALVALTADTAEPMRWFWGRMVGTGVMRDAAGDVDGRPVGADLGARARPGRVAVLAVNGDWWQVRNSHGVVGWVRRHVPAAPGQAPGSEDRQDVLVGDPSAQEPGPPPGGTDVASSAVPAVAAQGAPAPNAVDGLHSAAEPTARGGAVEAPAPAVVEAPAPGMAEGPAPGMAEAPAPGVVEAPAPGVAASPASIRAAVASAIAGSSGNLRLGAQNREHLIGHLANRTTPLPSHSAQPGAPEMLAWVAAIRAARGLFDEYAGATRSSTFLGHTVSGHAEFIARLRLAEVRLEADRGATGDALRAALGLEPLSRFQGGWNLRSSIDPHGLGTAVDLNYRSNPYVGNDRDRSVPPEANRAFYNCARSALRFTGQPSDVVLPDATRTANRGADWDQVHRVDQAIETYFSMLSAAPRGRGQATTEPVLASTLDPENRDRAMQNVRAYLISRALTPTDAEVSSWVQAIVRDFAARQDRSTSNWADSNGTPRQDVGILNLPREIPVALCDVAGMRWGASGFTERTNGDIQHFDASRVVNLGQPSVHLVLQDAGAHRALRSIPSIADWRR